MTCLRPVTVPSKAKGAKHGLTMKVPCGKCIGCLQDKQNTWVYRLQREQYFSDYSLFVTLTYDAENVPLLLPETNEIVRYKDYIKQKRFVDCYMSIYPRDVQLYFKRLRKHFNFKQFSCFEYGDQFNRPHSHFAIFFNDVSPDYVAKYIQSEWNFGNVDIAPLVDGNIYYVTKYILKGGLEAPDNDFVPKPCLRASHNLGVRGFLDDEKQHLIHSDEYLKSVVLNNGQKIPTPRYFRRIFYPDVDFDVTKQDEIEYEQNKREKAKFDRFLQDVRIQNSSTSFESAQLSYLQNNSPECRWSVYRRNLHARKGL